MIEPDDGHIGIRTNGKNRERVRELEQKVAEGLKEFRSTMYLTYIFINLLWLVTSVLLVKYSAQLVSIPIYIDKNVTYFDNCKEQAATTEMFSVSNFEIIFHYNGPF